MTFHCSHCDKPVYVHRLEPEGDCWETFLSRVEEEFEEDFIPERWFAFIRELWSYADIGYWSESSLVQDGVVQVRYVECSTGGWSGNEDLINAMQKSKWWTLTWEQSKRGGHYWFRYAIPRS